MKWAIRPPSTTGFQNFEATMGGKWLGVLKEAAPNLSRECARHWLWRYRARLRCAPGCGVHGANFPRHRTWLAGFGLAMKEVLRIDHANHPRLLRGSGRPTYQRS